MRTKNGVDETLHFNVTGISFMRKQLTLADGNANIYICFFTETFRMHGQKVNKQLDEYVVELL